MMKLDEAIADLHWIQERIQRNERVTCFRSASLAAVGLVAIFAGSLQSQVLQSDTPTPLAFVVYWSAIAGLAISVIAADILIRNHWENGTREFQQIQQILSEFGPCVVVGGVMSYAIALQSPQFTDLLPALWGTCITLGVCAVRHRLPGNANLLIGYYMLASIACLALANHGLSRSPWCVSLMFGLGHFLTAGILYWTREKACA